ncbi:MAG: aminodeoxychorismate lyase [Bacteroidales bacterium]|nr:aminodeoxychorismate lyase [Bacteroidales bacterium]
MKKLLIIIPLLLLVIGGIAGYTLYRYVKMPYPGSEKRIYISRGTDAEQLWDVLTDSLGSTFADHVMRIWSYKDGDPAKAAGSYIIQPGESAMTVASRLRSGRQNPVKVVIGGHRTFKELVAQLAAQLDFTPEEFAAVCDSTLPAKGFKPQTYQAAILPDTYEFYWNVTPEKALSRLLGYRDDFWNEERRAKAQKIGLTPIEVATLASIVEEETAKASERPTVARLYLNRLNRGMKLQADPTVNLP